MNTNIPCYVLHVKQGYEERTASIARQFTILDLPYRWLLAHDIPELSPELLREYGYHGQLRPQEISCCLKHISAWEAIARGEAAGGIVFEDDVLIDLANFQPVCRAALDEWQTRLTEQPACICFGDGCALYVPWTDIKKGQTLYPAEYLRAADSYWLSRPTATMMVDWIKEHGFAKPADHLIDQICAAAAIPIFWTAVTVVSQGSHTGRFRSSLQTQERLAGGAKKMEWLWKKFRRKYLYPLLGIDLTKKSDKK